jgi:hypothetical protein
MEIKVTYAEFLKLISDSELPLDTHIIVTESIPPTTFTEQLPNCKITFQESTYLNGLNKKDLQKVEFLKSAFIENCKFQTISATFNRSIRIIDCQHLTDVHLQTADRGRLRLLNCPVTDLHVSGGTLNKCLIEKTEIESLNFPVSTFHSFNNPKLKRFGPEFKVERLPTATPLEIKKFRHIFSQISKELKQQVLLNCTETELCKTLSISELKDSRAFTHNGKTRQKIENSIKSAQAVKKQSGILTQALKGIGKVPKSNQITMDILFS